MHFRNGVRGVYDCGAGAPDVPEVPYWWRKCRIGAQGTDGFAEVHTGGGWRAVTKDGVQSGPGTMDYDHDMPPYVQEMADWLDDDPQPHPLRFEHGLPRSRDRVRPLPFGHRGRPDRVAADERDGRDRGTEGEGARTKVLMTLADSAKEYKE